MSEKERNIQKEIMLWCGQHDFLCFRCNVGKVKCEDGTWFDSGLCNGFSDLIVLANNTIYFIEVKTKIGQQREDQKNFQSIVQSRGYTYIVARSTKDMEVILNG